MNSILFRALLAVVLMIGFYLLALAVAGGLLLIPLAELKYAHRLHPQIAIFCAVASLSILWAIRPQFDRFEPPGPRLTRTQHPRLFEILASIATAAGQPMPEEVYLCPDVNAWVSERGGIMGFGSRPVMGLGLPLLQLLTLDELRAVLAHEFGHYCSADTKLGPWTYKTRATIGRTLGSLGDSVLRKPFEWYGKLFLLLTNKVSRNQEFVADRLAAALAGSQHVTTSLIKVHGAAPAFKAYIDTEVVPILNAGFRPPIADGFAGFMQVKNVGEQIGKIVEREMRGENASPYESHPPLNERLDAVRDLPLGAESGRGPAIELLRDVSNLERDLVALAMGEARAHGLKAIAWEEAVERVYIPNMRKQVGANTAMLAGRSPSRFPELLADVRGFCAKLRTQDGQFPPAVPAETARVFAAHVLGSALGLALHGQGWKVCGQPGESVSFEMGSERFTPYELLFDLAHGKKTAEAWCARLKELGLNEMVLA